MKPIETEIIDAATNHCQQFNSDYQDQSYSDFYEGANWAISQMQPEWVAIDQYPEKEIPLVMRWHKFWKCPIAVHHRRAYSEPDQEWIDGTRDNFYSEAAFEPFFQFLPQPPTK